MKRFQQLLYLLSLVASVAVCGAQSSTGNEGSRRVFSALLPDETVTTEIERNKSFSVCVGNNSLVKERCLFYSVKASDPVNAFIIEEKLYNELLDAGTPVTEDLGIPGTMCNAKLCGVFVDDTGTDEWCIVVQNTKPWNVFMTFVYKGCLNEEEKKQVTIIIISILAVVGLAVLLFCGCCCYLFWRRDSSKPHTHSRPESSPSPCSSSQHPAEAQTAASTLVEHPMVVFLPKENEDKKTGQQVLPVLV